MQSFVVAHKFCGSVKVITGKDIHDAMRKNDLRETMWNVLTAL